MPVRSQSPAGVYQEIYGVLLAHYAVRAVMHEAALRAELDPDAISFVHTLRTLQRYLPDLQQARGPQWRRLYHRMLDELVEEQELLPLRRLRYCPRLIKRRINRYTIRTPARMAAWRKAQTSHVVQLR
jgi:hypothetical protein